MNKDSIYSFDNFGEMATHLNRNIVSMNIYLNTQFYEYFVLN